jgi:hypothetical protein
MSLDTGKTSTVVKSLWSNNNDDGPHAREQMGGTCNTAAFLHEGDTSNETESNRERQRV